MRKVIVAPGEHVESLAAAHGVTAEAIWDHPDNAALREAGRSPNVLHPGDVVTLPAPRARGIRVTAGQTAAFRAHIRRIETRIRLLEGNDPVANEPFVVRSLATQLDGTTDADGWVTFRAPATARFAEIDLPRLGRSVALALGGLDPVEEPSGVRQRLDLLGFYRGALDGILDATVRRALAAFQERESLPVTGEPDDGTRARLVECVGA